MSRINWKLMGLLALLIPTASHAVPFPEELFSSGFRYLFIKEPLVGIVILGIVVAIWAYANANSDSKKTDHRQ